LQGVVTAKEEAMAIKNAQRVGAGAIASLIAMPARRRAGAAACRAPRAGRAFLKANPNNPRRHFADAEIEELAASIRQRGLIQPIVVRPLKDTPDHFEIIAGERRWRAAQRAGLHEVPIVPLDVGDAEALEIAIIENVQRADLNAMEEAHGYHALAADHGHNAEAIAKLVGKSRSHVANMMRLTKLPDAVQAMVVAGELSGRTRARADRRSDATRWLRSCRGLERTSDRGIAHEAACPACAARRPCRKGTRFRSRWRERRIAHPRSQVSVDHRGDGSGTVTVRYRDLDQLEEILRRLEAGA